jgi:hypothetical protein
MSEAAAPALASAEDEDEPRVRTLRTPGLPAWWPQDPRRIVWGIVGAQAVWLLYLMSGGWYLQADLSNLAEGASSSLTWGYLTDSLGGHFSPVGRLAYWVLQRAAPMNYDVTIALRIVLQAVATLLLYRLLRRLVGPRPLVLAVVAAYALSPLVGPNLTYFTPGLGQTLGQVFALAMYLSLARWTEGRQVRWAAATGLLLLLMILGDDQMIVLCLTVPIFVVAFLDDGRWTSRLRLELRSWLGWLVMAVPTALYVVTFVAGGYAASSGGGSGSQLTFTAVVSLVRDEWLKAIGPVFVGGPLRWLGGPGNYVPFAAPSTAVVLLGLLVFLCLVVVGLRRLGGRSLWAWLPMLLVTASGIVLVGAGRYAAYGSTVPITWRYSFPVALPLAIGVTLALLPVRRPAPDPAAEPEPEPEAGPSEETPTGLSGVQTYAAGVLLVGVLLSSLVSGVLYARSWWRNPAKAYVATLVASTRAVGPAALLYDSPVRGDVISPLEPDHHVSDILRLEGVPARFDRPGGAPLIATADGRLVSAAFVPAATGIGPQQPSCGTYIQGIGRTVITLSTTVRPGEWYLQLSYFQAQPSTVSIAVLDAGGVSHSPSVGAAQRLPTLGLLSLRLPLMSPQAVVITSTSPATSLCLVHTVVGAAFPAGQ